MVAMVQIAILLKKAAEDGFEARDEWRLRRGLEELAEAAASAAAQEEKPAPVEAPAPVPADHPGLAYFRSRGYPEGQLEIMKKYWAAYKMGKEAGRAAELEYGGWATLKNKKRVMIYKNHAFEPPSDRDYAIPGPLKHLGKYNRSAKKVDLLAPGEVAPEVPQTTEGYPWWLPRASRA